MVLTGSATSILEHTHGESNIAANSMFSFISLDVVVWCYSFHNFGNETRKKLTEAGCAILHFPRHLVSAWQLKQQSLQQKELCLEWPKGAISFEPQ